MTTAVDALDCLSDRSLEDLRAGELRGQLAADPGLSLAVDRGFGCAVHRGDNHDASRLTRGVLADRAGQELSKFSLNRTKRHRYKRRAASEKAPSKRTRTVTEHTVGQGAGAEISEVGQDDPTGRSADAQPPMSSAITASKTPWWTSTSAVVVTGDISAMLWNGVSMMPRFNR